jgi:hypothetical protein
LSHAQDYNWQRRCGNIGKNGIHLNLPGGKKRLEEDKRMEEESTVSHRIGHIMASI